MHIEARDEPLSLRIGPTRSSAAVIAAVSLAYAAALGPLFVAGRLPWQDGPASLGSVVEDVKALLILAVALFVAGWRLWELCFTPDFELRPDGATLTRPLGKPVTLVASEVRPELVRTFVMGKAHHRVELPVGRRRHILEGGPVEHEPMLQALHAAIVSPSPASYGKLRPLAAHVEELRRGDARFVIFSAVAGIAALGYLALR